jgi:hypothetical protein
MRDGGACELVRLQNAGSSRWSPGEASCVAGDVPTGFGSATSHSYVDYIWGRAPAGSTQVSLIAGGKTLGRFTLDADSYFLIFLRARHVPGGTLHVTAIDAAGRRLDVP